MPKLRIYRVDESSTDPGEGEPEIVASFLVRAPNAAQAVRHVARRFKCDLATQDDLVALAGHGVKVQELAADAS